MRTWVLTHQGSHFVFLSDEGFGKVLYPSKGTFLSLVYAGITYLTLESPGQPTLYRFYRVLWQRIPGNL
jgi:hypothetical protein